MLKASYSHASLLTMDDLAGYGRNYVRRTLLISLPAWIALSVLLQVAAFPISGPMAFWRGALGWVALIPFLLALLSVRSNGEKLGLRQSAVLGYVCGFFFYLLNCSWIYQTMYLYGGLPKPVAFVILVLFAAYLGLYHALFAFLTSVVHRATSGVNWTLLLVPFAWVAVELARARITGFPWDLLGYSQIDNALMLHLAPLSGVMGISFALAAFSAAAVYGPKTMPDKRGWLSAVGACLVLLAVMFFGHRPSDALAAATDHAVLVQENLLVGASARGSRPLSLREELLEFSALSRQPPHGNAFSGSPAVVIWPEAPSHLLANDRAFQATLGDLARQMQTPLVIGSIGVDENVAAPRGYSEYDSAALFDRSGKFVGRYDKIHLVPWGEYVPFKQFFAFAQKLTEGVGDMDPGSARTLFQTNGHTYGIFICYESIFGDEVRQFVRGGAQVLINISDDGWYGDTGAPWQHLNMARMRAVENHRWILRDTNTGETTTIDPQGRYTNTERHVRTAFALPFSFDSGQTIYTQYGDWLAWLCCVVTAVLLGFSLLRRNALN